jgi:hypothetical protein
LLQELLQTLLSVLVLADLGVLSFLGLEQNEVLSIKSLDHFFSVLLILSGGRVNVLTYIRGVLMNNELTNLLIDLSPDILFLLWLWGIVVNLLSQMV